MCWQVLVFAGKSVNLFTKDSLCSPIMPGLVLDRRDAGSSFKAPWWALPSYKDQAFDLACTSDSEPTVLDWYPDGKDQKLVVRSGEKALFKKGGLTTAEILGDKLRLWNRKGQAEDKGQLWGLHS